VNSNNGPSGVVLCLMRIAFVVMIIILVVMVLLTGVYYALDLAVQGTCRTVHDDQPFLINFITGKNFYIFIWNLNLYFFFEFYRQINRIQSYLC
jgi:hypothetical protein